MMFIFQNKENKDLINAINFILGYKTRKPELFKLALLHKSIKTDESLSVVPESFFIIDLPIQSNEKKAKNIYECFDLYTEPEYLEGDNAWYNDKTKQKT